MARREAQDRLMRLLTGNGPEEMSRFAGPPPFTPFGAERALAHLAGGQLSPDVRRWVEERVPDERLPEELDRYYLRPAEPGWEPSWSSALQRGPLELEPLTYTPSLEEQRRQWWAQRGQEPQQFGATIPDMLAPMFGTATTALEVPGQAPVWRPLVAEGARTEQTPPIPPELLGTPLAQRATGAGTAVQPPGDAMGLDLPPNLGFAPPEPEQPLSPFDEAMRNLIAMEEGLGESPMEQALARVGRLGGPAAPPRAKRVYAPYADPQAGYAQWRTAAQQQANQTYNQSMNRWAAQMQQVYGEDQAAWESRREAVEEAAKKLEAQGVSPEDISRMRTEATNRQHTEAQTFEVRDRVRRARDMEDLNRRIREQEVATGEINVQTAVRDYLQEPETRNLEIETQRAQLAEIRQRTAFSDDEQNRKRDRELGQDIRNLQSDISVRPYQTALVVLRNGLAGGLVQQDEFDLYLNQITERRDAQQETDRATRARERAEQARSLLDQPAEDLRRMNDINRDTNHLLYRQLDDAATDKLDEEFAQAVSGTPGVDLNNAMQQHQEALTAAVRNASQLGGSPSSMLQEYINHLSGRITNLPPAYIQSVRARIADVQNKESQYGTLLTEALQDHLVAREQAEDPDPRIRSEAAERVDAAEARLFQILMRLSQVQEQAPAATPEAAAAPAPIPAAPVAARPTGTGPPGLGGTGLRVGLGGWM